MVEADENISENLLIVIQQLHSEKLIDQDKRNLLKGNNHYHNPVDMVFEDDVKLIGLFCRYSNELEELKSQIVKYISSETFSGVQQS